MLNIEITETKNFVKKLLMEPVFDTFLLVEAYVIGRYNCINMPALAAFKPAQSFA